MPGKEGKQMRRRANGEGSIRQRTDGRWEGRYAAGYDILTGKRITKSVYAQTKTDCAAKLSRAITENSAPYYRAGIGYENRPLADWCRFWFETYCKPGLRPNSVNSYTRVLEKHIIPLVGDIKLARLSSVQVQQMCHELKERGCLNRDGTRANKPLSVSYVRHIHGVLKSCLQQAVADRIIPFNPCENSRLPRRQKKKMVILPLEKIGAYLQAAEEMGVYSIFVLELTSGLRRGELLALLWSDLDVNTRALKINKQITRTQNGPVVAEPKTPNAVRTVVLPQQTVDALIEEHNRHPDSPLMFCSPRTNGYWEPNSVDYLHKRILAAAGIDEPVRFHDLRHTFATIAVQNGVDVKTVSSMLGHHSAAFTLDAYTHVTEEMQRGAAEKIEGFINNTIQLSEQ